MDGGGSIGSAFSISVGTDVGSIGTGAGFSDQPPSYELVQQGRATTPGAGSSQSSTNPPTNVNLGNPVAIDSSLTSHLWRAYSLWGNEFLGTKWTAKVVYLCDDLRRVMYGRVVGFINVEEGKLVEEERNLEVGAAFPWKIKRYYQGTYTDPNIPGTKWTAVVNISTSDLKYLDPKPPTQGRMLNPGFNMMWWQSINPDNEVCTMFEIRGYHFNKLSRRGLIAPSVGTKHPEHKMVPSRITTEPLDERLVTMHLTHPGPG